MKRSRHNTGKKLMSGRIQADAQGACSPPVPPEQSGSMCRVGRWVFSLASASKLQPQLAQSLGISSSWLCRWAAAKSLVVKVFC